MSYNFTVFCDSCKKKYPLESEEEFKCGDCLDTQFEKVLHQKIIQSLEYCAKVNDEWKTPEVIEDKGWTDRDKEIFMLGVKNGLKDAIFTIAMDYGLEEKCDSMFKKYFPLKKLTNK